MRVPNWLSPLAKDYWKIHRPMIELRPEQESGFAVLAECYAEWRNATDLRSRKIAFDHFYKLAREFNVLPRSRKEDPKPVNTKDKLDDFLDNN